MFADSPNELWSKTHTHSLCTFIWCAIEICELCLSYDVTLGLMQVSCHQYPELSENIDCLSLLSLLPVFCCMKTDH